MFGTVLRITALAGLIAFVIAFLAPVALTADAAKAPDGKVNINSAGVPELATLPRIGEKIAQKIVDYRNKNGAFKTTEELMKVSGIGEKIYLEIKSQICVSPAAAPAPAK
ncbi:MAG: helix-hairpin-helix domain-containing protein [Acidobacteriota bacterium]